MPATEYTLYHGTTEDSAARLLAEGWAPNSGSIGGNCGQRRYLYLTNGAENALWFAEQKGGDVVLEVRVPADTLRIDPEDGIKDTVEEELNLSHGLPGNVVLTKRLDASAFARFQPAPIPTCG